MLSIQRRFCLVAALATSVLVSGCGGGGGGEEPALDLYAAYGRIAGGMRYAAVVDAVGVRHNAGENALPTETVFRWETGVGTAGYTGLSVTVDGAMGVIQKVVNGPRGNLSQSY